MAQLFLDNLEKWNGRCWFSRPVTLEAGSDASEFGFGGTILVPGESPQVLSGQLSVDEMAMSSTAREMVAFFRVLEAAVQSQAEHLKDSAVPIRGDNQGAVSALNSFRSPAPDVNAALRGIFELCAQYNFDVVAEWRPRDLMALEDELSKIPDSSDWGLIRPKFRRICEEFGVEPRVDLFALATWHQLPAFISDSYTPGALGINALRLDWTEIVPAGTFAWAFPPVRLIPQAI